MSSGRSNSISAAAAPSDCIKGKHSVRIQGATTLKLAKYLMRSCTLINCSHRHIKHNLLATDRVLVDGEVENNQSRRIRPGQHIVTVLGPTILAYNKPCGILTALSDSTSPCIGSTLPVSEYLNQYPGLHNVGRLDQHSCGLLLLTNDGHITRILTDPKRGTVRRYNCVVTGIVDTEKLTQQVVDGVQTRYGTYHGKVISAAPSINNIEYEHKTCTNAGEVCLRNDGPKDDIQYARYLASFAENHTVHLSEVVLEITEGKKREVRRMLAHCGHPVLNLRREAYGKFKLNTLKAGEIRFATTEEMDWVNQLAS